MFASNMTNEPLEMKNPYTSLFWDMIASACEAQASDIHIQPDRLSVQMRFRIHGELMTWKSISEVHKSAFLQESKRLCQCALGVSGRPQDVRFSVPELRLDVRVNLIPTLFGEKLVLRLLYQSRSFDLDQYRIGGEATTAIRRALKQGAGVCLMTGPTGSGKTTLLYSALNSIDRTRLNVVTIEDPVEYSLPGISQVQVNHKLSFSDALRAILRQDPDVILVGEIRDRETAELCFQAAATGHLVLSTLHANSATEIPGRLTGLGVREDMVSSCLRFGSAQRLLSELCPKCSRPVSTAEIESVFGSISETATLRKRSDTGCSKCKQGFIGVLPVFEYGEWSGGKGTPSLSLDLHQSALSLAQEGRIDAYEAFAV